MHVIQAMPNACGDGKRMAPQEGCDDGNVVAGDGCDGTCRIEAYFVCSGGTLYSPDWCVRRTIYDYLWEILLILVRVFYFDRFLS